MPTMTIEVDKIVTGFGENRDKARVTIEIHAGSEDGAVLIDVWIPEKDSISEIKKNALIAAKNLLQVAILSLSE